uniref:Myosin motor domain-containing protein n=1 Tax=Panagrellus redivivus TaxID=6233 RepID=A0A7E4VCT7_PANRE
MIPYNKVQRCGKLGTMGALIMELDWSFQANWLNIDLEDNEMNATTVHVPATTTALPPTTVTPVPSTARVTNATTTTLPPTTVTPVPSTARATNATTTTSAPTTTTPVPSTVHVTNATTTTSTTVPVTTPYNRTMVPTTVTTTIVATTTTTTVKPAITTSNTTAKPPTTTAPPPAPTTAFFDPQENSTFPDFNVTTTTPVPITITVNCSDPQTELEIIYCDVNTTTLTPSNVTHVANQTTATFNTSTITPQQLYMVSTVIQKCSQVKDLTPINSIQIGELTDKVLGGSSAVFERAESGGLGTSTTIYNSVSNLLQNSEPNITFLTGKNFGFISHPIDCRYLDANGGGMGYSGSSFDSDHRNSDVSISVKGGTVCGNNANHVYYTIYRSLKLFDSANTTFDESGTTIVSGCQRGYHSTDDSVLSATAVQRNQNGFYEDRIVSRGAKRNEEMVEMRFKKNKIRIALHGKYKVTYWLPEDRQWATDTCSVATEGNYYVSTCTHLTDFTLIIDGASRDPILCDTGLEVVNYIVVIGSILSLFCVILVPFVTRYVPFNFTIIATIRQMLTERSQQFEEKTFTTEYRITLLLFFIVYIIFTKESHTTGRHGCMFVAGFTYWLLIVCIFLSIFQSWMLMKKYLINITFENVMNDLTQPIVVYIGSAVSATVLTLAFGLGSHGNFFYRDDSFCWIRPDYVVGSVVVPTTFLIINSFFCGVLMLMHLFPKLFPMLSYARTWHYLFAIVNGAQGIVQLAIFCFDYVKTVQRNSVKTVRRIAAVTPTVIVIDGNDEAMQHVTRISIKTISSIEDSVTQDSGLPSSNSEDGSVDSGDFIWIEPFNKGQYGAPIGARVISSEAGRILVVDDQGNEQWLSAEQRIRIMHPTSIQGVEDMIEHGDLHEAGILRNLFVRYKERLIYTYTGSILVAVNPYTNLPLYTTEFLKLYRNKRIGELSPHIFAIADNAYANMRLSQRDQCVIISGESGAGKTESTKLVLQFLATVSGQHSWIEQQVLDANPIMEAFGNAKTVRNDNSSRFGKYIDIHFNTKGAIDGARIEQYLLEKSRIVSQANEERNYHIFYCLLAGLSETEKAELKLTKAEDYHYLNQGRCFSADGRDDAKNFSEIRSAMKVLNFKDTEVWSIFKILAAILHMGNVKYHASMESNLEVTKVVDKNVIKTVAKLLEFDEAELITALTTKSLVTRGDHVVKKLSAGQALETRDGLVKHIYGRLFVHIVRRINDAIYKPHKDNTTHFRTSIGILDIFGFENFKKNSFEQLCINYANEHLQQFFVQHVFKIEQAQYDGEEINWRKIEFVDNQSALDLIANHTLSIMALIDEESIFPNGTDQTLLNKLHQNHARNEKLYVKPRGDLSRSFGIQHFAGEVLYSTKGFLEKNRDHFGTDLALVVHSSRFKFLRYLFDETLDAEATRGRTSKQTVGSKFRKSLEALMNQLHNCEPFFIRCIKPNEFKTPMSFDRDLVLKQLRYSGMMETIRIRKAGYPIRHDYFDFVSRYRALVPGMPPANKIDCTQAARTICTRVFGPEGDYQLGKTKVFLKDNQDLKLEQEHERYLTRQATLIQTTMRGWLQRRKYERMRYSAIIVQKHWRRYIQHKKYKQILLGIARLQAVLRSKQLAAHYRRLRGTVTAFQAACRGTLIRDELRSKRSIDERRQAMLARTEEELAAVSENGTAGGTDGGTEDIFNIDPMFEFLQSDSANESNHAPSASMSPATATSGTANEPPPGEEPFVDENLEGYQFAKFAATYFQGQASAQHIRKPLRQPLLHHENTGDQVAALAVWVTILRFMGDLPDPKTGGDPAMDKVPVMAKIYSTLGRKFSRRDVESATGSAFDVESNGNVHKSRKGSVSISKKLMDMTIRKKSNASNSISGAVPEDRELDLVANGLLENRPTTTLDKLHFIIGHGILRPALRDEIYAQICKQLCNNPSKNSYARGWILLSLCAGCFAPSERFIKYLYCFIREHGPRGQTKYSTYIEHRLRRTVQNGTRHQPPSYIELQATKSKKPLVLAVTFMDGTVKTMNADSATTARELCTLLAEKIGLMENFGFSLYIALFDKVSSLGAGNDHVMDAVSQCEQFAKEQGREERNAPWRLFFRKEIFTPWHDPKSDPISTNLIYQQVVRGVKYGEYRCDREEDLVLLAAQQFYVDQNGPDLDVDKLEGALPAYLPDFESGKRSKEVTEKWLQAVMHVFRKKFLTSKPTTPDHVKEDVVTFAQYKWPLLFSRFYEAYKFSGPPLPRNEVIVAVNFTGIYVVDDQEQVLAEFSFPEISAITCSTSKRLNTDTFTIQTVLGLEYTFQSPNSEDIRELVVYFLAGLKKRSKYAIATTDQKHDDRQTYLEVKRGDLLILAEPLGADSTAQFVRAESTRTNAHGNVAVEGIYVLPTLTKPSVDVVAMFSRPTGELVPINHSNKILVSNPDAGKPYSLERFAVDNFRPPGKRSVSNGRRPAELWRYSREPLKAPLLRKLEGRSEPCAEAIASYLSIMKYMGDHPTRRTRHPVELTDAIFRAPLQYEVLRDETYCQLMKQLTDNTNMYSEERGWELFWLCIGLFPPSKSLYKEVLQFLRSRVFPVTADCASRLQKTLKAGQRKYPPHLVEVEAIQHKTTQIFHKAFFPDGSNEAIEVESSTRARDFCNRIATRLALHSADGFSLFVKVGEKVISMPENEFFFDFIHQLTDWVSQNRPGKDGLPPNFEYQIFFMRKLWINVTPGDDINADLIFHYHQELPKYLRGYHNCGRRDAAHAAALILRAQTRDDREPPFAQFNQVIIDILPKDLLKQHSVSEWKKLVLAEYNQLGIKTSSEAKIAFLKFISTWPTFGSAFFEVKQSSDPTLASRLLIAINKNGVNLYNHDTKEHLISYPFNVISNWTSGNTYFHMTVGNLMKGNRLLLETTLGYKMDDLLSSYIQSLLSGIGRNAPVEHEI